MIDYSEYLDFIKPIVEEAGKFIIDSFGSVHTLDHKFKFEFKTKVDDDINDFLLQAIQNKYPKHSILSEESTKPENFNDWVWIIDPLDGTLNFTLGVTDLFAISVALMYKEEIILGVTYAPIRKEIYYASKGHGAYKNNERLLASKEMELSESVVAIEYGKYDRTSILPYQKRLLENDGVLYTYVYCNASVPMCLVADQKIQSYLALELDLWDMAAGVIINREMGNIVTTISGDPWDISQRSVLVGSKYLSDDILNKFKNI
ncbi:MAG: hypothetical protein COA79_23695 [Planctomycetota bacterium]|nr:MAG: hypothetical protein COA79_23695 [Planctomycetota bacterium]